MDKMERIMAESDCYTPLEYISDTLCYVGDKDIDVKTQFLALLGVNGEKTFFKTLFYSFKLENDIGENEFSSLLTKHLGGKSVISVFKYYACDEIYKDVSYLNELFSIINIKYDNIKKLYDDDCIKSDGKVYVK